MQPQRTTVHLPHTVKTMTPRPIRILLPTLIVLLQACTPTGPFPPQHPDTLVVASTSTSDTSQRYPATFVNVSDIVPDAMLDIRYFSTYNFAGTRIDGYHRPLALLTLQAAEALQAVSIDVQQQGYRLKIFDAYRPQRAVEHFIRWSRDAADTLTKQYFYPSIPKHLLFVQGYLSHRSSHSRGSAVDLTLVDMATGHELNMGTPFDFLGPESHTFNHTATSSEQYRNRLILHQAMLRHGFKALPTEWWHFTLINEPYPNTYFDFPIE